VWNERTDTVAAGLVPGPQHDSWGVHVFGFSFGGVYSQLVGSRLGHRVRAGPHPLGVRKCTGSENFEPAS
jgi:hypothetical protein